MGTKINPYHLHNYVITYLLQEEENNCRDCEEKCLVEDIYTHERKDMSRWEKLMSDGSICLKTKLRDEHDLTLVFCVFKDLFNGVSDLGELLTDWAGYLGDDVLENTSNDVTVYKAIEDMKKIPTYAGVIPRKEIPIPENIPLRMRKFYPAEPAKTYTLYDLYSWVQEWECYTLG